METAVKSEKGLQRVSRIESWGGNGKFNLEIYVDAGRELTDNDNNAIFDASENIKKAILQESYRLNPKYQEQGKEEIQKLTELFAGHEIFVGKIPNEYSKSDIHSPWLIVTTKIGHIKIGWRKRVINIDWSKSTVKDDAETLFPGEDVTKYEQSIHAWGYEKAKEYLDVLFKKA